MNACEERFWKQLISIQSFTIGDMLCQTEKYTNLEELLIDTSYNLIYRILELVDGYMDPETKYKLIDTLSGTVINSNGDLHNGCEERLMSTNK